MGPLGPWGTRFTAFANFHSVNTAPMTSFKLSRWSYSVCVCVCVCVCACAHLVNQLCPTLCDPTDCRPPDSSVHEIFQERILDWVAFFSSRWSSQPRDCISCTPCIGRWTLYDCITWVELGCRGRQAHEALGSQYDPGPGTHCLQASPGPGVSRQRWRSCLWSAVLRGTGQL